jgi:hypothetical protein
MSSKILEQKEIIEQLKMEVKIKREKLSFVIGDLISYCEKHQKEDALAFGFKSMKDNPFQEKSGCSII